MLLRKLCLIDFAILFEQASDCVPGAYSNWCALLIYKIESNWEVTVYLLDFFTD